MILHSNLSALIQKAVNDCMLNGESCVDDGKGLVVFAEWVDSSREGYTLIRLTISENGIIRLVYDDYGTEIEAE